MAKVRFSHNSFSVGVISQKIKGNTDFEGYNNALDMCENFQIQQTGGLFKRGGTHFVSETKLGEAKLVMFVYSAEEQYLLEFGEKYIRFYTKYGVLYGEDNTPYELTTDIPMASVRSMHTFQDGNQLIIISDLGMHILTRETSSVFKLKKVQYTCEPMTFPNINRIALKPDKKTGTTAEPITITIVDPLNPSSKPSTEYAPLFFNDDVGHEICLRYNISKNYAQEEVFYYLKIVSVEADGNWKKIKVIIEKEKSPNNELPDLEPVTKFQIGAFSDSRGHPKAVAVFEGRLFLACNKSYPVGIWGSAKLYHDWSDFFLGILDTDSVQYKISYQEVPSILWMVGQSKLFIGTTSGIFMAGSSSFNDEAITPSNFSCRMFSAVGASPLQPIAALDTVFFVDVSGRNVHEIYLNGESGAYEAHDISVLASDLTQSGIIAHTWQQTPVKTYWCAVNDGFLCALTYMKDMGIMGWTKHVIAGKNVKVEDLCCMRGTKNDLLWMIVRREVNGVFKRYIEYMHPPYDPLEQEEFKQYYVDSGVNKEIKYKVSNVDRGENSILIAKNDVKLPDILKNGDGYFCAFSDYVAPFGKMWNLYIRQDEKNPNHLKMWSRIRYKEKQIVSYGSATKETWVIKEDRWPTNLVENNSRLSPSPSEEEIKNYFKNSNLYIKVCDATATIDPDTGILELTSSNASFLKDGDEVVLNGFTEIKTNYLGDNSGDAKYWDIDNNCPLDFCSIYTFFEGDYKEIISYNTKKTKSTTNKFSLLYKGKLIKARIDNAHKDMLFSMEIYKKMIPIAGWEKGVFATLTIDYYDLGDKIKNVYINKIPGMDNLTGNYRILQKEENTCYLLYFEKNLIDLYKPIDLEDYPPYDGVNPNKGNLYNYFDNIEAPHLAGQEVCIMKNGNSAGTAIVPSNGIIKVPNAYYASIGLRFKARFQTTSYSGGCLIGSSVGTVGGQNCFWIYVYYSLGGKYGSEMDKIYPIPYKNFISKFDKPKSLITGLVTCPINNAKDVYNRSVYIENDEPLSFNILSVTQEMDVSDA